MAGMVTADAHLWFKCTLDTYKHTHKHIPGERKTLWCLQFSFWGFDNFLCPDYPMITGAVHMFNININRKWHKQMAIDPIWKLTFNLRCVCVCVCLLESHRLHSGSHATATVNLLYRYHNAQFKWWLANEKSHRPIKFPSEPLPNISLVHLSHSHKITPIDFYYVFGNCCNRFRFICGKWEQQQQPATVCPVPFSSPRTRIIRIRQSNIGYY